MTERRRLLFSPRSRWRRHRTTRPARQSAASQPSAYLTEIVLPRRHGTVCCSCLAQRRNEFVKIEDDAEHVRVSALLRMNVPLGAVLCVEDGAGCWDTARNRPRWAAVERPRGRRNDAHPEPRRRSSGDGGGGARSTRRSCARIGRCHRVPDVVCARSVRRARKIARIKVVNWVMQVFFVVLIDKWIHENEWVTQRAFMKAHLPKHCAMRFFGSETSWRRPWRF